MAVDEVVGTSSGCCLVGDEDDEDGVRGVTPSGIEEVVMRILWQAA